MKAAMAFTSQKASVRNITRPSDKGALRTGPSGIALTQAVIGATNPTDIVGSMRIGFAWAETWTVDLESLTFYLNANALRQNVKERLSLSKDFVGFVVYMANRIGQNSATKNATPLEIGSPLAGISMLGATWNVELR